MSIVYSLYNSILTMWAENQLAWCLAGLTLYGLDGKHSAQLRMCRGPSAMDISSNNSTTKTLHEMGIDGGFGQSPSHLSPDECAAFSHSETEWKLQIWINW